MATSSNLTNPNNPRNIGHVDHRSWDYKEDVVAFLIKKGVPLRPAEVAAIDFKTIINTCYHNKLTPAQAANMLYDKAVEVYTNDDGSWHYSS